MRTKNRETLREKIKQCDAKIEFLQDLKDRLIKEDYLLSDEKQWYKEERRIVKMGRKNVEILEGRIYWKQKIKDEDNGKEFEVERSMAVKIDGEWI